MGLRGSPNVTSAMAGFDLTGEFGRQLESNDSIKSNAKGVHYLGKYGVYAHEEHDGSFQYSFSHKGYIDEDSPLQALYGPSPLSLPWTRISAYNSGLGNPCILATGVIWNNVNKALPVGDFFHIMGEGKLSTGEQAYSDALQMTVGVGFEGIGDPIPGAPYAARQVDLGAGTTNGLVFNMHVDAPVFTTATGLRISLLHSTSPTSTTGWTTIQSRTINTFTPTSRKEFLVRTTGTVNRYLAISWEWLGPVGTGRSANIFGALKTL